MKAIGRTQSAVIAALAIVAILAGGWFLLVTPAKSSVNKLKTQAQSQESANSTLQLQLSVLRDLAKKLPQQQADLARIKTKVPDQVQLANLLRQLVTSAADSGVKLNEFSPLAPAALVGATGIDFVDLTITFTGGYAEVEQFDSALESLSRTLMVKDFSLVSGTSASSSAPGTTGSASGSSSASTITATFNGRVLVRDAGATSATKAAGTSTTSAKS